jgi:hypothetical protein
MNLKARFLTRIAAFILLLIAPFILLILLIDIFVNKRGDRKTMLRETFLEDIPAMAHAMWSGKPDRLNQLEWARLLKRKQAYVDRVAGGREVSQEEFERSVGKDHD